ncbi:hypothetical protein PMZ80_001187 [Knufia obscura]|uniref:Uncharacterized protein n=1 Tax=Knufia obscura TaxID=1635080 RepID=A0ABR0S2I8_9EURO|nr:hypothetical protein PMZ80_001187 [Knufia obscura]
MAQEVEVGQDPRLWEYRAPTSISELPRAYLAIQLISRCPRTSFAGSFRNLHGKRTAKTSTAGPDGLLQRARSRPLSWLSFGKNKFQRVGTHSPSMPLPHPSSMSSVANSSISSPMLRSTTNPRVADVENIECSDVLLPDYSSNRAASRRLARADGTTSRSEQATDKHSAWASTVRSVKKKLSHTRRASTSLLLDSSWVRRAGEKMGHSATPSAASGRALGQSDSSKSRVHQGQAGHEQFTDDPGSTTRPPKDTSTAIEPAHDMRSTPNIQQAPRLPGLYSDSTTDLNAVSLSRSFASAVDKLDFQSSPTLVHDGTPMSRLKKAKSYFSLHKASREDSLRNLDNVDLVSNSSSRDLAAEAVKHKQRSALTAISRSVNKQAQQPKIAASRPAPLRFSGTKNRYIQGKPDSRAPRGVNPLRMHPEVKAFAKPPSRSGIPVTPGHVSPSTNDNADDPEQSESIDKAVIYCPSTGTLSEYSRQTPSPEFTSRRDRAPQDTPTRKPLHKTSGSMLKKSVSTFFGRSASMMKLSSFTPSRKSKTEQDLSKRDKRASWHTGMPNAPLRETPARHRSMSTPDMNVPDSMRAVWDYQPSTPSPLRKSTRLSTTATGRRRAVTTTTPVKIPAEGLVLHGPRSATVLSNPEKRSARYIEHGPVGITVY